MVGFLNSYYNMLAFLMRKLEQNLIKVDNVVSFQFYVEILLYAVRFTINKEWANDLRGLEVSLPMFF